MFAHLSAFSRTCPRGILRWQVGHHSPEGGSAPEAAACGQVTPVLYFPLEIVPVAHGEGAAARQQAEGGLHPDREPVGAGKRRLAVELRAVHRVEAVTL